MIEAPVESASLIRAVASAGIVTRSSASAGLSGMGIGFISTAPAILRRRNGLLQVTLRGMPLYRFSGDHAKGQANGEGIESFGGIWHAVAAAGTKSAAPTPSPPSPAPMTPGY